VVLFVAAAVLCGMCLPTPPQHPPGALTIFDSDPNHIWNRTYTCLFVRQSTDAKEYGADALDLLLWNNTHYLLTGDSHRRALACLDEFLRSHGERAVEDPLKRAILQRDLWAVFDWTARNDDLPEQRRELESRLAVAIHRLALTPEQIRTLSDTYDAAVATQRFASAYDPRNPAEPFLPPDLFRPDGPWVCLSAHSGEPTALQHFYFSGRSRFLIFIRLPGGRDATLAYIERLRSSAQPPLLGGLLNLALPQFPVGTHVALVRQLIVVDSTGKLVPTKLTESVQLRVYHAITPGTRYMNYINGPSSHDQDFFEFRMSRPELFAGRNGGLVAVGPTETEFATFNTHGMDAFDQASPLEGQNVILKRCVGCHSDSGIHSVQSRTRWMKQPPRAGGHQSEPFAWETDVTIARKAQQVEFKLLQRLWQDMRD
jgi:plasmid stabilization system protein ParE